MAYRKSNKEEAEEEGEGETSQIEGWIIMEFQCDQKLSSLNTGEK